jgi:uncharacterized protein
LSIVIRFEIIMLIGLISDSHDNLPRIRKAVSLFNEHKVDLVLHAGDIVAPFTANEFEKLHAKFIAVFGNNDGEKKMWMERVKSFSGEVYDNRYSATLEGLRLLLIHDPINLNELAKSEKYDIIIYGHTHKPDKRLIGKTLALNPGECGGWVSGISTVGLLELPSKKFTLKKL